MQIKPLPISFLRGQAALEFSDLLWGYEHQMIGWTGIVELATRVPHDETEEPLVAELSTVDKDHTFRVGELIRELAGPMSEEKDSQGKSKWLRLLLTWLFFNLDSFSDPLGEVELIYAEFDYPHEIESFVRYMPPTDAWDPTVHTLTENEQRLFENWKRFLMISK